MFSPETSSNDYLDALVNGNAVRQRMADLITEAEQHRLLKEYRRAHPEQGWKPRTARVLRRAADRLAPEQPPRQRLRLAGR